MYHSGSSPESSELSVRFSHLNFNDLISIEIRILMNETSPSPESHSPAEVIPATVATEIRRLAHDLSNALEIVIQSSYLLSTSPLDESSKQWIGLLNEGVKRAASINIELREYIRRHS